MTSPEWFPRTTLGAVLEQTVRLYGARPAVVDGDLRWTWRDLKAEADAAAKALIAAGVEPGDRVALWMTNRAEFLAIALGALQVGAVFVPLNTRYRVDDVGYAIRHSGSRVLILLDRSGLVDYLAMAREALPGLEKGRADGFPELKTVAVVGTGALAGAAPWAKLVAAGRSVSDGDLAARVRAVDPDAPCLIAYTSGTTGSPKAVLHGHICVRSVVDRNNRIGLTGQDAILNYLPMFHLYAISESFFAALLSGACQVVMDAFEPARALDLVEAEKITILHGFDTHYRDLMRELARRPRDVSSLRFCTFPAGNDETAPVAEQVEKTLCPSLSGYGMTEVWAHAAISFPNSTLEQRSYASGFPMPGMELRIADPESGALLPDGEQGELQVRGYAVMRGYFRDEAATSAAFTPDGWFRTGDLALMRPDGHMRFLGRHRDALKIGGENVSPAEVEAYLARHPAVAEVAVVGYPDPRLTEVAVAFVRPHPGVAVAAEELIASCKGRIASYKIPRHVLFVDALPMTPTGKIQKHLLRQKARAELD